MCEPELTRLLERLGLERHLPTFEEEAITELSLLQSMGPDHIGENLEELGLDASAVARLSAEIFGAAADGAASQAEASTSAPDGPSMHVDAQPSGAETSEVITQEEAEAEQHDELAKFVLRPFMEHDLPALKKQMVGLLAEGNRYLRIGQFANARAAYTRALSLKVPNKKAVAALYYNRAACNHKLGQPHLAAHDARLSAEADPLNARAWWRAADAAYALDDAESAGEAVKAGLTVSPRCAALKALAAARNERTPSC